MIRHWTPKPVIISCIRLRPTGGNSFFAVVKSFEYKIAISANFVQTVKNAIGLGTPSTIYAFAFCQCNLTIFRVKQKFNI